MEEKKQNENQKLSYEKLSEVASELHVNYQKAIAQIQQYRDALDKLSFNRTAFLLDSLFKVMDHVELYDEDFAKWAKDNIQQAVTTFYDQTLAVGGDAEASEEEKVNHAS